MEMKKCKDKNCRQTCMLEPDFSKKSVVYYNQKGELSTVAFPSKLANHGLCWYHRNQQRFGNHS